METMSHALLAAAATGNVAGVKAALRTGADVNSRGRSVRFPASLF